MDSFQARSLSRSMRRRAEGDAAVRGFPRRGDQVRGVQQRLGRDAAAVQADAAEPLLALDEDDFLALVRRVERRGVSARAGADDHDFSFDWFHIESFVVSQLHSASVNFSNACTRSTMNRAALPPSITRWSYDSASGSISRGLDLAVAHHGFSAPRPRPRMATSGLLMIGVKCAAADAALVRDRERAALQFVER